MNPDNLKPNSLPMAIQEIFGIYLLGRVSLVGINHSLGLMFKSRNGLVSKERHNERAT